MRKIFILLLMPLLLSACSGVQSNPQNGFTTENIMKIKRGMSSDEILGLFGEPNNVRVTEYDTTWEYGDYPIYRASFEFSGEHDSLKLDSFNIKR